MLCHLVTGSRRDGPYLACWAMTPGDPLLVDTSNVRLACRIDPAEMRLDCTLHTWNRKPVKTFSCQDTEATLLPLIRQMATAGTFDLSI